MFRTTALPVAVLLGLTTLVPTGAQAAGETCRGQAATFVGHPDQVELIATEGPDVVVTNGAFSVETLGGDDLVCVTGGDYTDVRAGDGNDIIDASALTADANGVAGYLGAGEDLYYGSAAGDEVVTGEDTETDAEADVVDTGTGGYDLVYSGQVRVPNSDRVSGHGVEIWWRGRPTSTGAADGGGDGTFRWYAPRGITTVAIDAERELLTADVGGRMPMSGFTSFAVDRDRELRTVRFRGTDRDESLRTWGAHPRTAFRVAMEGGDDWVSLGDVAASSALSGGGGADQVLVGAPRRITLSLTKGRLKVGSTTTRAAGFEHATVRSPDALLTGTGAANVLTVNACRATVHGLGGSDTISTKQGTRAVGEVKCRGARRMHGDGDGGDDDLTGSRGADVLIGGPGRDRADGDRGRDTCQAERVTSCEVRR